MALQVLKKEHPQEWSHLLQHRRHGVPQIAVLGVLPLALNLIKVTLPTGTQVGYQIAALNHVPLLLPQTLPRVNPVSSINRPEAEEEGAEVQEEVATGTRATSEVLAIQSIPVEAHMHGTMK